MFTRRWFWAVLPLLFTFAGCGDDSDESASTGGDKLTVFAASSLTEAFTALGSAFETANPGTPVAFSFGASSSLVAQIGEGAPVDVFASADEANMTKLVDAGHSATAPVIFATNRLAIIVEPGNPKAISGIADLARTDVIVVTGAPEVPIGRYTAQVFAAAGVAVTPKSFEDSVKAVANKVVLGEADAGIVYVTDVKSAGTKAQGVAIPDDINVVATYPATVVKGTGHPASAAAFVDFLRSPAGTEILKSFGFGAP